MFKQMIYWHTFTLMTMKKKRMPLKIKITYLIEETAKPKQPLIFGMVNKGGIKKVIEYLFIPFISFFLIV